MPAACRHGHDVVDLQAPVPSPALLTPAARPPQDDRPVPLVLRVAVDLGVPVLVLWCFRHVTSLLRSGEVPQLAEVGAQDVDRRPHPVSDHLGVGVRLVDGGARR